LLWNAVQQVQLDASREDSIVWWWIADGEYTTKKCLLNPVPRNLQQVETYASMESKSWSQMQVLCIDVVT
jgi:hypothetical protein